MRSSRPERTARARLPIRVPSASRDARRARPGAAAVAAAFGLSLSLSLVAAPSAIFRLTVAATLATLVAPPAQAAEFTVAALRILDPKAMPSRSGRTATIATLTIVNRGPSPDRLLRVRSPSAAAVEFHAAGPDGDGSRPREFDALRLPPGQTLTMGSANPAGLHLKLLALRQPLKPGDTIELLLEFEFAGRIAVTAVVSPDAAAGTPAP